MWFQASQDKRNVSIPVLHQGLSVTELEAQMLARGGFVGQQQQQQLPPQVHQQAGASQPAQRPAQGVYNQGSSGLYSPSAAAALARLTQSAQQGHQPQASMAGSPSVQGLSPMLQSSVLANQMQQRQARSNPPGYGSRPGLSPPHLCIPAACTDGDDALRCRLPGSLDN